MNAQKLDAAITLRDQITELEYHKAGIQDRLSRAAEVTKKDKESKPSLQLWTPKGGNTELYEYYDFNQFIKSYMEKIDKEIAKLNKKFDELYPDFV